MQQCKLPFVRKNLDHGGDISVGTRKTARPVTLKRPMFFTFKSSLAKDGRSFHRKENRRFILEKIQREARQSNVQLLEFSINTNHLHMLLKAMTRGGLKRFLRVVAGSIASFIMRSKKSSPTKEKFWDHLPHSIIINGLKHYENTINYIIRNVLESEGQIPYEERKRKPPNKPKRNARS